MPSYYLQDDGSSHLELDDASGDLILDVGEVERSASLGATAAIAARGSGPFAPSRLSQLPVEALVRPEPEARASQLPVEVLILPDSALARVSQLPVEVVRRRLAETVSIVIWD